MVLIMNIYILSIQTVNESEFTFSVESHTSAYFLQQQINDHLKSEKYFEDFDFGLDFNRQPQKLNFSEFELIASINILPLVEWANSIKLGKPKE